MSAPAIAGREFGPQSLLGPTIQRALRAGRLTLAIGTAWSLILGLATAASSGSAYESSFPLILPIFGSMGALGALTVFTGDRTKGVLEYLMAYGVSPKRLFSNFLVASLVAVAIIVSVATAASVSLFVARGNHLSSTFLLALGVYAIPMSFASTAFSTTIGMYWSALSSPRDLLNSPIGLAPMISLMAPVATLVGITILTATFGLDPAAILLVTGAAVALVALIVLFLLGNLGRFLRRERFLSTS